VKKHVLVAPGVDNPEALVRESLDGAFCHLSNSSISAPQRCPKTPCSGCSTAKTSFYRVDWLQSTHISQMSCLAGGTDTCSAESLRVFFGWFGKVSVLRSNKRISEHPPILRETARSTQRSCTVPARPGWEYGPDSRLALVDKPAVAPGVRLPSTLGTCNTWPLGRLHCWWSDAILVASYGKPSRPAGTTARRGAENAESW